MIDSPKAVIFDMDGVITDTMQYHYRAWDQIFRSEGIVLSKYDIYKREGQKGIVSVREIFADQGKSFSLRRGKDVLAQKENLFKKIVRRRFIAGSRSFVKMLARKGVLLALVTGTSRHEINEILPDKLLRCFSVIVSGSDVRNGKPHPEPYQKAIKTLKIKKGEGVVIENAPFGICSAKTAGLTCFAIETSLPRKYLRDADRIFSDFSSLRSFFLTRFAL